MRVVDTKGRSDNQVEDATHDTALYKTIRLGYENGHYFSPPYYAFYANFPTGLFTERSPFHPLGPEETYFSGQLDELKVRFTRADESELTSLAHDLIAENKQLERFITKANLETWFKGVLENAKNAAMRGAEGVTEYDTYEEGDTTMEVDTMMDE